jgi:methyl-accepting chemotaxis protein
MFHETLRGEMRQMLRHVRIGTRLSIGFGIVLLLLIAVGGFALYQMTVVADLTVQLHDHPFAVSNAIRSADSEIIAMDRDMRDLLTADTVAKVNAAAADIDARDKQTLADLAVVRAQYLGDTKDVDAAIGAFTVWKGSRDEIIALARSGKRTEAEAAYRDRGMQQNQTAERSTSKIIEFAAGKADSFMAGAAATAQRSFWYTLLLIAVATVVGAIFAVFLTRSMVGPLAGAVTVAERVAAGDLTVAVPADDSPDEAGTLVQTLGRMVTQLRSQIGEIIEVVTALAASAAEITATSAQLAAAAAETAASYSETTLSIEEVKQTAQASIASAQDVSAGAQRTMQVSQTGEQTVTNTLEGIRQIREQMTFIAERVISLSEQGQAIGELIATVDDIAEQSNLLAVNAAIEAAKAGDQGKGFAVVAREVKSLAEQSRQATRQVRGILNEIQKATGSAVMATEQGTKTVESGVRQSAEVREALRVLGTNIAASAQMSHQIVAASQQQFTGIDQVTSAMESIREASGQNLEGARQLEVATRNLDALGQRLKQLTRKYRV